MYFTNCNNHNITRMKRDCSCYSGNQTLQEHLWCKRIDKWRHNNIYSTKTAQDINICQSTMKNQTNITLKAAKMFKTNRK